ncbi:MAG: phosphatidate cytidylyltransferase [Bacillota bacterium]
MSDLRPRVMSSLVFVPLFAAAVFFGGVPFLVFCIAAVWAVSSEMRRLAPAGDRGRGDYWVPSLLSFALILAHFFGYHLFLYLSPLLLLTAAGRWSGACDWREVTLELSWRVTTAAYVGLIAFWPALRAGAGGREHFFLVLLVAWANDTAAYFAGSAWGARKLVPGLSPGKSRVGAAAGIIAGVAVGAAIAAFLGRPVALYGAIGLLLAAASQLGDLFESMLKRGAEVKDAGRLIPGHGGVLDRIDGLLFAAPVMAALVGLGFV